jgi:hypothetical protein
MSRRARVHLDATRESSPLHLRAALCGFIGVSTTSDASLATCKSCLARLRGDRAPLPGRGPGQLLDTTALAKELHIELGLGQEPTLAPNAGPPPRLTPQLWASSCRGGQARCRDCELCTWQSEVERWSFAAPWSQQHGLSRGEDAPRWGSLSAALVAMLEYERSGRDQASALGGILERADRGETGKVQRDSRHIPKQLHQGLDVVHVRVALERVFSTGNYRLSPEDCARALLERTPGLLPEMRTYEALSERYGLDCGELQSIVRRGRQAMEEDLCARGLIPVPRTRARVTESAETWSAIDAL